MHIGSMRAWRVSARVRALLPGPDTPYTVAFLTVLVLVTGMLNAPSDPHLTQWASTNLTNLHAHPIAALLVSIFIAPGHWLPLAAVFAVASSALERRAGALWAALVPLAAHSVATLVTEGVVGVLVRHGLDARSSLHRVDTGVSYVAFSAAAAAIGYLPRRSRAIVGTAAAAIVAFRFIRTPDMTESGHILAAVLGVVAWLWLPHRAESAGPRMWNGVAKPLAAAALAGLALIGVVLVATDGGASARPVTPVVHAPPDQHAGPT